MVCASNRLYRTRFEGIPYGFWSNDPVPDRSDRGEPGNTTMTNRSHNSIENSKGSNRLLWVHAAESGRKPGLERAATSNLGLASAGGLLLFCVMRSLTFGCSFPSPPSLPARRPGRQAPTQQVKRHFPNPG